MYKKQKQQFGLNDPTQMQTQQQTQIQQPDLMGMLALLQQGTQQNINTALQPRSRISKDQGTQRGTPGLDQWHANNPGAPQAGTFQPDGNYGAFGADIPAGELAPQQPEGPGFGQQLMGMLGNLFGGGQQQQAQQQAFPADGVPVGQPSSHTPVQPQRDPQIQNLMDLGGQMNQFRDANSGFPQGTSPQAIQAFQQPMAPPKQINTAEGFNQPIQPQGGFAGLMGPNPQAIANPAERPQQGNFAQMTRRPVGPVAPKPAFSGPMNVQFQGNDPAFANAQRQAVSQAGQRQIQPTQPTPEWMQGSLLGKLLEKLSTNSL